MYSFSHMKRFNWLIADFLRDKGNGNNNDTMSIAIPILMAKRVIDMRAEFNRGFSDGTNKDKSAALELEDGDLTEAILSYQTHTSPLAVKDDCGDFARLTWEDIMAYPDDVSESIEWEFKDGYGGSFTSFSKNKIELFLNIMKSSLNTDLLDVYYYFDFERKVYLGTDPILNKNNFSELLSELGQWDFSLENAPYDIFSDSYMDLLEQFAPAKNSKEGEFFTPHSLGKIMPLLLKPQMKSGRTVNIADLSAGSSTLLIQAGRYMLSLLNENESCMDESGYSGDRFRLIAQDKDPVSSSVGKANMILNGFVGNSEYFRGNTITEYRENIGQYEGQIDYIVANPPFAGKDYGLSYAKANELPEISRWMYGLPLKGNTEAAFLQTVMALLSSDGKACVILPHGLLFRSDKANVQLRKKIIEDGHLEAVVGCPSGMFATTGIAVCMLVINKNKSEDRRDSVLFINAENDFIADKKQNTFSDDHIAKIVDTFDGYEIQSRYSNVVSVEELRSNNYNLNIRRYADTSPPSEQFDVKAILNGGVPVSEVEDEYIQETLNGMDVSCVFVRRDDEYYDFKLEIEAKEQLRDYLGEVEQPVISQFERWWDKYRVSLHEIDTQVKQSEEVMWGYLKELGYE